MNRKRSVSIISVFLVIILMVTALSNCGGGTTPDPEPEDSPDVSAPLEPVVTPSPEPSAEPEPEETEAPYTGPYNPLTGLPCEEGVESSRPYAIMINNIKGAQPLLGVADADILYEVPVEGGITRMLAVYQDVSGLGNIGSVRSARPCFLDLAQGLDAIYVHAGGSPQAYSQLKSRKIAAIDGVNGSKTDIFFRDAARRKSLGYEHSLVTSGARISQYVPTYGLRMEHETGYASNLRFAEEVTLTGGKAALSFTVPVTSSKKTAFTYQEDTGRYTAAQFGSKITDGTSSAQVSVSNVLVLKTDVSIVDSEGRLSIKLTGSGDGLYFTGGEYVEIKWSKSSESAQFSYTYADGSELTMRAGRTYVCITSASAAVSVG